MHLHLRWEAICHLRPQNFVPKGGLTSQISLYLYLNINSVFNFRIYCNISIICKIHAFQDLYLRQKSLWCISSYMDVQRDHHLQQCSWRSSCSDIRHSLIYYAKCLIFIQTEHQDKGLENSDHFIYKIYNLSRSFSKFVPRYWGISENNILTSQGPSKNTHTRDAVKIKYWVGGQFIKFFIRCSEHMVY